MSVSESSSSTIGRFAQRRRAGHVSVRRQRGVTAILAAVCIGLAIAALGVIDVGNYYFARREMQRTADLAAAAGAQTISNGGGCTSATNSANNNAVKGNGLSTGATVTVVCGRWDPTVNAGQSYFATSGAPMNAVQVTVSQTVPYFFAGPARVIQAVSTAQATNIRSFSVTPTVASLSGGLLNGLLNGLLPGANLNLSVASYQGLATTQIKLGDLAAALGVGTMSQLLGTQVSLAKLVSAMVTAAGKSATLGVTAITDLGTIQAAIPSGLNVALGANSTTNGLLTVALDDPQAAVNATVSLLDTLLVAAEVAQGQSAVNLGTALNLSPLANVTAQVKIIEPPVIAVGEAGQNADGTWRTSAHSADVRLYLNINLLSINLGLATVTALNLPIYIEVGTGTAWLQSTQCTTSKATSQSVISAQPGLAYVCVGNDAISNFTNTTTTATCNQAALVTNATVGTYSLISIYAGNPTTNAGLSFKVQPPAATPLTFNGISGDSDDYQTANSNAVGSVAINLLTQINNSLLSSLYLTVGGVNPGPIVAALLQPLLTAVDTLLSPLLTVLDGLLVPLLQLLGVQIGEVTVHDLGLACGQAQLVY